MYLFNRNADTDPTPLFNILKDYKDEVYLELEGKGYYVQGIFEN